MNLFFRVIMDTLLVTSKNYFNLFRKDLFQQHRHKNNYSKNNHHLQEIEDFDDVIITFYIKVIIGSQSITPKLTQHLLKTIDLINA